jgi:hypothetical protein
LPPKGGIQGDSDFVREIAFWIADFTLAALLSVLADACAFAFCALVSSSAMFADAGAFAFCTGVSISAMLADAGAFAFCAAVSVFAMLADAGTFAFCALGSSSAMLAYAGAFAFCACVSLSDMLAKCLVVANGAVKLQLVMWAPLTTPSHFLNSLSNLQQAPSLWSICFSYFYTLGCDRNRMQLLSKVSNIVQNIFCLYGVTSFTQL